MQVWRRLLELELMGHPPDKCEMIILGGTWDSYDAEYRDYFIHQLFYACNVFHKFSLRMHGELSHLTREWANQNPFTKGMAFDPESVSRAGEPCMTVRLVVGYLLL
jgi:histone acetyltransferase (RNA polymerase elongator complex component)